MLLFSGFNGFGQFGSVPQRHVSSFTDFNVAEWPIATADDDIHVAEILIAPSWSYTAYAHGRQLLLRGFLTDTADAKLEVHACGNIQQLVACDRFCLTLLDNGQLYKILPQCNATLEQIKFVVDCERQILPQKRTVFGVPKEASPSLTLSSTLNCFKIVHIACGANITVAISNTNVVYNVPNKVLQLPRHVRVQQLLCGFEHALLLTTNGDVYSWGNGLRGQLGQEILHMEETPQLLEALAGIKVTSIAAGGWHSAAISAFGDLYTWGYNSNGQLGLPLRKHTASGHVKQPTVYPLPQLVDMPTCSCQESNVSEHLDMDCTPLKVYAGARHTLVRMSCGAIYAVGWNSHGQLGLAHRKEVCDIFEPIVCLDNEEFSYEIICGAWCTVVKQKRMQLSDKTNAN